MERGDDDDETLEPHADVDEDRQHEQRGQRRADLLEPEELRQDHVAAHHGPVGPGIGPERAVLEGEQLVGAAREPGDEELQGVGVTHHRAGEQHDLGHVVQVLHGDDLLEAEGLAHDHHQRHHHGEAREDGPGDEVGREDRGVPAGELGGREVHRHDRVDGQHQRRREARQDQVRRLVVLPMAHRAAPAESEHPEGLLPQAGRAVAHGGHVRDQADVPEEQGDGAVDRDREDVPHQGAAELRPHPHLVRDREHPVRHPGAADVDAGEDQRARHREEGHRLRRAVDRGAPLLAEEEEDRRDQGAGVADADPEDEVGDVEGPADGVVEAPDADPLPEQPGDADAEQAEHREGDEEADPPAAGGRALHRPCHRLGDGMERLGAEDQWGTMVDRIGFGNRQTRRRLDGLAGTACDRVALALRSAHSLLVAVWGAYPCPAIPTFRFARARLWTDSSEAGIMP